jgi:uncharacterized MnhB-related membrane protein
MLENIYYLLLILAAAFCAYRAMISTHLLPSALYLACISACVSVSLYKLGAFEVAVIELSVGAGLVTVLLVYALSMVGEDTSDPASIIPKPFVFLLVGAIAILAGWMAYPIVSHPVANGEVLLADVLWKQRALDVWVQVALVFSGVMGVLGMLSEQAQKKTAQTQELQTVSEPDEIAAQIEQEMHV